MSEKRSREELALQVAEAEWQWLKPHLERGSLITVAAALDLAEAGERIAADDVQQVGEWISSSRIGNRRRQRLLSGTVRRRGNS